MCNGATKTITCRSKNNKVKSCDAGVGETITWVVLDKILSEVACMHSPTPTLKGYKKGDPGLYGWEAKDVWVSRGCKAKFKVCCKGN